MQMYCTVAQYTARLMNLDQVMARPSIVRVEMVKKWAVYIQSHFIMFLPATSVTNLGVNRATIVQIQIPKL